MLASLLSKLLASLLVTVLVGATVSAVVGQTLLNNHYLEGQLQKTDSYNRLSAGLTDQLSQQATVTNNPLVAAQLKNILTPALLKQRINSALDQLQIYYRGDGPAPVIDLTDIVVQAQAAGLPVGADSGITKPIVLGSNNQVRGVSKKFDNVRLGAIIASVVLVGLLLAVSWERHRWAALPDVLISVGVLLALLALLFGLTPRVADHILKLNFTSNAFASIAHDLVISIVRDLSKRFGVIAGVCLAVGVGTRIWVGRLKPKPTTTPVPRFNDQTLQ